MEAFNDGEFSLVYGNAQGAVDPVAEFLFSARMMSGITRGILYDLMSEDEALLLGSTAPIDLLLRAGQPERMMLMIGMTNNFKHKYTSIVSVTGKARWLSYFYQGQYNR